MTTSSVGKNNLDASTTKNTNLQINPLSKKEMDAVRKDDPRAYMRMMLMSYDSSTNKCFSSSTVSDSAIGPEPISKTLKQLNALVEDVNLFKVLENNFIYGYNIKTLIKKLDVPDAPTEVVDFLATFGPIFDQIWADLQSKHDTKTKMMPKETKRSKAWNLTSESNQHKNNLKRAFTKKTRLSLPWMNKLLAGKRK